MKKYLLIIPFILLIALPTNAQMLMGIAGGDVAAAGAICPAEELKQTYGAAGAFGYAIGQDDANDYLHMTGSFTASSSYQVTKVIISGKEVGAATGNLYLKFWEDDGTGNTPNTTVITNGTSDAVDGSAIGTVKTDVTFTYTSRPSLIGSTVYHAGPSAPSVAAEYWIFYYETAGSQRVNRGDSTPSWTLGNSTADIRMEIYGCTP